MFSLCIFSALRYSLNFFFNMAYLKSCLMLNRKKYIAIEEGWLEGIYADVLIVEQSILLKNSWLNN